MTPDKPEFSRIVEISAIDEGGLSMAVEADAAERGRLARRFGLVDVGGLAAAIRLAPEEGGRLVRLAGTLTADVTQTCVVTLGSLPNHVEATLDRVYATVPTARAEESATAEENFDPDAGDVPDPVVDGRIDVGEAVAEELALSLDPFPRKPGITFQDHAAREGLPGVAAEGGKDRNSGHGGGPFAALAKLRDKLK